MEIEEIKKRLGIWALDPDVAYLIQRIAELEESRDEWKRAYHLEVSQREKLEEAVKEHKIDMIDKEEVKDQPIPRRKA